MSDLRGDQLKRAQDHIGHLTNELNDLQKQFADMKEDLITRLQAACTQRDEARSQVLEVQNEMERMRENAAQKDRQLQNACGQCDEARAQVLHLHFEVERLQKDLTQKDRQQASSPAVTACSAQAVAAAASITARPASVPAPAVAPGPGPATTAAILLPASSAQGELQRLQASAQGDARQLADGPDALVRAMPQHPVNGWPAGDELRPPSPSSYFSASSTPASSADSDSETETDLRMLELHRELEAAMIAGKRKTEEKRKAEEKRKTEEGKLLAALADAALKADDTMSMGFHKGKPVAAIVVYRYCLHSRAFQADRTAIFDRITNVIGQQVEKGQEDNACLLYWLTNTATLVLILDKNIKPAGGHRLHPGAGATGVGRSMVSGLFLGRAELGGAHDEASTKASGVGSFQQVEAKYPARLFQQQLDALVQRIFPMIRDNVRKEISPMLPNCILPPKAHSRTAGGSVSSGTAAGAQQAASHKSWGDLLVAFDTLLGVVKDLHVPKPLVQALFEQLFRWVNVQLFNQLLLRRECCSFSNGEYVKTGLEQVAHWINTAGADYIADSWEELKFLRQAVTFLVIGNKPKKPLEEFTDILCPALSIQQLYRISTMYWDGEYNTETASPEVMARMKQAMVQSSTPASHSFLLDVDSSLPFQARQLVVNMDEKDLYGPVAIPESLKDERNAAQFIFLEREMGPV